MLALNLGVVVHSQTRWHVRNMGNLGGQLKEELCMLRSQQGDVVLPCRQTSPGGGSSKKNGGKPLKRV